MNKLLETLKYISCSLPATIIIIILYYKIDNPSVCYYKTLYVCIVMFWVYSFLFFKISKAYNDNIFYKYNILIVAYLLLVALKSFNYI